MLALISCSKMVMNEMKGAAIDEGEKALKDIEEEVVQDAIELANKEYDIFKNTQSVQQKKQNL